VRRSLPGELATGRTPGNDTAAIMLTAIGSMPARARIAEVARALDQLGDASQWPPGSPCSRSAGCRRAARQAGQAGLRGRFFSLIASVMPGWRRELRVLARG